MPSLYGDIVPVQSGFNSIGVDGRRGGFDESTIRPLAHLHLNSGVFHTHLGSSGIIRFRQTDSGPALGPFFELSIDAGRTYDVLPTSGQIREANNEAITHDLFPGVSGASSLGVVTSNGVPSNDIRPYNHVHLTSGVIHNLVGGSGVLRTDIAVSGLVDLDYSKDGGISFFSLTEKSKSITVETPTATEDIMFFYTDVAITIRKITVVLRGTTPSVTWTLRFNSSRAAAGTEIITTGRIVTDTTTGQDSIIFSNPKIPADSFVWLETTAISGTVDELALTIIFSED